MQNSKIENVRHTLAHLLAAAVEEMYPDAKRTIGPTIEDGFYYDFDNLNIGEKDLARIEKRMRKILPTWKKMEKEVSYSPKQKAEAKKRFSAEGGSASGGKNNTYKKELIDEFAKEGKPLTFYKAGEFSDLCRGGHVKSPAGEISTDAFKLIKVAGAYWRGDENNQMLTRIYGVAFETKKELVEHLERAEEAEKRDHRRLGKELGLFTFSPLVGAGLPLFMPKGAIVRRLLANFSEEIKERAGFAPVDIPHIAKKDLYRVSGHLDKFGDDVFYVKGMDSEFVMKPMNCPHHTQIYASEARSYRDLPVLFYDTTRVYRDEQTGELGGLTRVRSITQDDSHAFCRPDQIEEVFNRLIGGVLEVVKAFKLKDYRIDLSLRDEKNKKAYLGDDKVWNEAQKKMEKILKENKVNYQIAEGEAAFYGPKMDFIIKDSLSRDWQISTIQLDLNTANRFELEYIDEKGSKQTPVIIHSAFLGSLERFMGIIIEHFAGAFPVWLSPVQAWVVPLSDKFNSYGKKAVDQLQNAGVRVELRDEAESLGKKIRNGELQKIPYILVVGEKEKKSGTVAVRDRKKGDEGSIKLNKFIDRITEEIRGKK